MDYFDLSPDIQEFDAFCSRAQPTTRYCREVIKNVVCYDGDTFRDALNCTETKQSLQSELIDILDNGSGVFSVANAYTDLSVITTANLCFDELLEAQGNTHGADHFANTGINGRLWNSFQKHALHNPENFIEYYKNPVLDVVASAWLGPHYQMTAQVNIVRPGGQMQSPHRDYHLGFQSQEALVQFPVHVHHMSPKLTLQGAIAHSDMPLHTGPTMLLPFSQLYIPGYAAWQLEEFRDYFNVNSVQLPLNTGDVLFFNPALFHAAGSNKSHEHLRRANLLQISSPFGKPMESIDLPAICSAVYSHLRMRFDKLDGNERHCILTCLTDGYPFPTNLDRDPPLDSMAPKTHRQWFEEILMNRKSDPERFSLDQSEFLQKRNP